MGPSRRRQHTAKSRQSTRVTSAPRTLSTSALSEGRRGHLPAAFIDTYIRVAVCKLYDRKHALCAADALNNRVLPFFGSEGVPLLRVLTDRGSEYSANVEQHEYEI
jgi:hypothetical protein